MCVGSKSDSHIRRATFGFRIVYVDPNYDSLIFTDEFFVFVLQYHAHIKTTLPVRFRYFVYKGEGCHQWSSKLKKGGHRSWFESYH